MGCASAVGPRTTRLNQDDTNGEHPCPHVATYVRRSPCGIKLLGRACHAELIGYPYPARQGLIFSNQRSCGPQRAASALSATNADALARRCDPISVGLDPDWRRLHDSLAVLPKLASIARCCSCVPKHEFETDPVWPAWRQPADKTDIQEANTPEQATPIHGQRSREKRAAAPA